MRRRTLLAIAFGLLAAVLIACGGGSSATTQSSTPTPAGQIPDDAPERFAPLTVDEYLVKALGIHKEASEAGSARLAALPDLQEDTEVAYFRTRELLGSLGREYGASADALEDVTPPAGAEEYHEALLEAFRRLEALLEDLAGGLELSEYSRRFAEDFLPAFLELNEVASTGQQLAVTALGADSDDPLDVYLASAIGLRVEFASEAGALGSELQAFLTSARSDEDIEALAARVERLITRLEGFEVSWSGLAPPERAADLHKRQAELQAESISVDRESLASLRGGNLDELPNTIERLQEFAVRETALEAGWAGLLIIALLR